MDTSSLKTYAPTARRDFLAAVTARAAAYGLHPDRIEPIVEEGDVALIGGKPFPRSVAGKRRGLEERIAHTSFDQLMEAMAYTWFNRLMAIRYMELHGYLDHGYRVLSHPDGKKTPEILEHATEVDLPGLDQEEVIELKLDGTKDEDLYRQLLLGQCHALHEAMPFLFESLDDETELLLPANLLHTDSRIRQLVESIPEDLWQEIEIIGWLYQFYISEKKDQVIGKVVKSEDIPAATQLFTPNWIVKYMVQNSLGAQWLATYPESPLKGQMEYYIEPAEQTDEVQAQLAAITPSQLNPEELTLIDPASGSGHILVEAYELFKAIYLERGYRQRDVPQLILEKNVFGLEICPRAAQLTGFALMMKGRADDRWLFEHGVKLNVMALVDSAGFDAEELAKGVELGQYGLKPGDLTELKRLFEHATTFGSLIQVPEGLAEKLPALRQLSKATSQDLFVSEALKRLGPLVHQAEMLAAHYDTVLANPPYITSKYHTRPLKNFLKKCYAEYAKDTFSAFIDRDLAFNKAHGWSSFMSPQVWMFISNFEALRERLIARETIWSLVQPEYNAFWDSAHVSICSYVIRKSELSGYGGTYIRLTDFVGADLQPRMARKAIVDPHCGWRHTADQTRFNAIQGSPVAYWLSDHVLAVFEQGVELGRLAEAVVGLQTGDNDRFVRRWSEVDESRVGYAVESREYAQQSSRKWFPYNKGGYFRKWYGNQEFLVNWEDDGREIRSFGTEQGGRQRSRPQNTDYYFLPSLSWSDITSGPGSFRVYEGGFIHDVTGMSAFRFHRVERFLLAGFCNTPIVLAIARALNPTVHFQVGDFISIPFLEEVARTIGSTVKRAVELLVGASRVDWNAYERSWDFQSLPLLTACTEPTVTLASSYTAWVTKSQQTIAEMKRLEEEINRLFIDAYGLADELSPDVPIEQITLTVNPAYRYGAKLTEEEQATRFHQDTMEELVSFAIGCMMGRYSLDAPGLIYAHSGNEGFDPGRYTTFPADDDGIIPITDIDWFKDDAAHRLIEFLSVAWDKAHLEENLTFLVENLKPRRNESSRETIRRYLGDRFFKDHLKTYKKRPIYWLFSSGKQKAFQCIVYLHRYNEGTLARMRTEYVIPLQGKIASRIDQLDGDIAAATSTSHRRKLEKRRDTLVKQRAELKTFDENLRHYADQRIHLDLDDGVKVNYGKFGDLLAEVKAVTGKKAK